MPLRIEETFQVRAPVDTVWAYLTDPRKVVTCLPGAEFTSAQDDTTFLGRVKVKVGPIAAAYNGKATITERDAVAHVVRVVGEGRESAGAGSARMTMTSTLAALSGGGTEVRVVADVDIVGKMAQFGRGMIESVNKQLFKQFSDCVRATLEAPATGTPEPDSGSPGATATPAAAPQAPPQSPIPPRANAPVPVIAAAGPEVRVVPLVMNALLENVARFLRSLRDMLQRR